jgi:hypothetical protein
LVPGFSLDAQKEVSSVAAAVAGYGGKLFPMPLDRDPRSDRERTLHSQAGAGRGRVFESGGAAMRLTSVFPGNLGHSPHDRTRFDLTPVHAICIGLTGAKFSYLRLCWRLVMRKGA